MPRIPLFFQPRALFEPQKPLSARSGESMTSTVSGARNAEYGPAMFRLPQVRCHWLISVLFWNSVVGGFSCGGTNRSVTATP